MIARLHMLATFALGHLRRDRGQAAPEYVMIIGFISLVIVLAFAILGTTITDAGDKVVETIGCWADPTC